VTVASHIPRTSIRSKSAAQAEELGIEAEPDELTSLSFGADSYLCTLMHEFGIRAPEAAFEDVTVSVSQHLLPGSISDPTRCVEHKGRSAARLRLVRPAVRPSARPRLRIDLAGSGFAGIGVSSGRLAVPSRVSRVGASPPEPPSSTGHRPPSTV